MAPSRENAWLRQVTTYWDTAASLLAIQVGLRHWRIADIGFQYWDRAAKNRQTKRMVD